MRDEAFSLRRSLMACACGALLALGSAVSAQAQTQAQEEDEDTFEQRVIKNILGGLGVDVGRPGIDYRERSPLVIPPTLDLPPPEAAGLAASNPAWPREPELRKQPVNKRVHVRAGTEDPGTSAAMTPDELRRGISARGGRVNDALQGQRADDANSGRPSRPSELGNGNLFTWDYFMGKGLQESATFTGEPARSSLTQPPPGYQTPATNQPYAAGEERGSGWKVPSILDRPVGRD